MNICFRKWIALLLTACLLFAAIPALTEDASMPALTDDATGEVPPGEPEEGNAEPEDELFEIPNAPPTTLSPEELALDQDDEAPEEEASAAEGEPLILPPDAPEEDYAYARVTGDYAVLYRDEALTDALYALSAGDCVLAVEWGEDRVFAAVRACGSMMEGYVPRADLSLLGSEEVEDLMDLLCDADDMMLYHDNFDWPLPEASPPEMLSAGVSASAMNADFTRISNDKKYKVQGKTVCASMVGNYSDCWSWARALYKIIWGVKFGSDFVGDKKTGLNLIRNLKDSERKLTGQNLKNFLSQAELGCTLRICSCPLSCPNISRDGCSKHEKHSLIVVARDDKGMVVMDNMTGSGSVKYTTRYYTYDKFASHWAKYKMIKYIKWPNAPLYDKALAAGITPEPVLAESLNLNVKNLALIPDQTYSVTSEILPANTTDKTVTWQSADPFVAYAEADGTVRAVATGKTTLTAATSNGITAEVAVSVTSQAIKPTRVTLNKSGTVTLGLGTTLQLAASVAPAGVRTDLTWKSSDKKIAKVSTGGLVTPLKIGTCTVAVTTANKKTAKVKIKVVNPNKVSKVVLNQSGTVKLNLGGTLKLSAAIQPSTAKTTLTWKSSNTKVAKVASDGTVTALKAGTCTIGVRSTNKKSDAVKVKVVDPNAPAKVTLDKTGTVKLNLGETLKLTPSLSPDTAKTTYTWKSSDKKIAKVASDGTVTPVREGTCTVGVSTANKKVAKVKIKVVDPTKPTKVALDKSGTVKLNPGETLQLNATVSPATAKTKLAWKSSNKKIAKVASNGTVTAVKPGTCTVAVTTSNKKTAKVKIRVADPGKPSKVTLDRTGTVQLKAGATLQLNAAVSPSTASTKLTWKSTDKQIAKITSSGKVYALKAGTCTVGVITSNKKYATVKIKVVK